MQLTLFKTMWGHEGSAESAVIQATQKSFDGIEGPAPSDPTAARDFAAQMQDNGLDYIAEITTAGSFVPERNASLQAHLDEFERKLDDSLMMEPLFITCLGGCDAWPEAMSIEFFTRAMEISASANIETSFETHRSRSMFNPWVTERIVAELPNIKLTCDYSHWCVVCERLMDTELDTLKRLSKHAHHIHARVGYEQGAQVPHPAAPEYEYALRAHQSWWEMIWLEQNEQGRELTTMTPEFGPDGYLQSTPFDKEPVADLWDLNCWMAEEERGHLAHWLSAKSQSQPQLPTR